MAEVTTKDGVKIHYEVEGRKDGPPLVFSNSLGTNLHMWDAQAKEAIGLGFRVIRYDQRGHGQSDAPQGNYTLGRLADDVIELLDALAIEKTSLLGLSMGGMTAMHLAKRYSRRFTRVTLCNTASFMPPKEMWAGRIKSVTEGGMQAVVDAVVARWFTEDFIERAPDEVNRIRAQILGTNPGGYVGCCAAIRDMDERNNLGTIEAPVLVVIGAKDPACTPAQGEYVAGRIPGARTVVLDAAHLSNVERPEDFNRAVFGFLAGGKA